MNPIKHITLLLISTLWPGLASAASVETAVGDLASGLQQLEADPDGVGLAACVARSDRVLMLETRGRRAADSPELIDPTTRFRIASLSKGFAATLAAQLVAEGRMRWTQPVVEKVDYFVLKDAEDTRRAQLDHVLSHRMGLPHNAYDNVLEAGRPVQSIVRRYADVDPMCRVGTCYGYQNIAYNLVTDVIENGTGLDYESEIRNRLFRPLGMDSAGFGRDDLLSSTNWAQPHIGRGSRLRKAPVREHYYQLPASAGINASIEDLCLWLRANLGGMPEVIPDTTRELLWTERVETRRELFRGRWRRTRLDGAHYGYGWRIYDYAGERVIFHAGSVQGYGAQIAIVPRMNVGVVAVWNSQSRRPWGITATFLDALLGLKPEDWLRLEEMKIPSP